MKYHYHRVRGTNWMMNGAEEYDGIPQNAGFGKAALFFGARWETPSARARNSIIVFPFDHAPDGALDKDFPHVLGSSHP